MAHQQDPFSDAGFVIVAFSEGVLYKGVQQWMVGCSAFSFFNIFVGTLWNVSSSMFAGQKADPKIANP